MNTNCTPDQIEADWQTRQAADYFETSLASYKTAYARDRARQRFLKAAKLALPIMGLQRFLERLKAHLQHDGRTYFELAEKAVRELPEADNMDTAKKLLARASKLLAASLPVAAPPF